MAYEQFIEKRFSKNSLAIIKAANIILREYELQGFDLSLRQLYYQFVARGWLQNSQKSYKNLGAVVADGRMAGLIDWDSIKDRGRTMESLSHWESPAEIISAVAKGFTIDLWKNQPYRVVVMVEKQALEGVLVPVCRSLDVTFIANKGYSSASALYELAKEIEDDRRETVVLYFGDHDPSGIDMTRDVYERLQLLSGKDITVDRMALNMPQVKKYNPPPNPAKETDARFSRYINMFGETCWELDALNPTVLADLVRSGVGNYINADRFKDAVMKQTAMRDDLEQLSLAYEKAHEAKPKAKRKRSK